MKILEEIKQEHDEIREYFLQMENNEEEAPEIFREFATFILTHHEAEEHTVFTELSRKKDVVEVKNNLLAEHAAIRRAIQIVLDTPEEDKMWKAHVHLTKDVVLHHAEEEEHELFDILRDEKEEEELNKLYEVFEAYFEKVKPDMKKKVEEKLVIRPEDRIPKEPGKK